MGQEIVIFYPVLRALSAIGQAGSASLKTVVFRWRSVSDACAHSSLTARMNYVLNAGRKSTRNNNQSSPSKARESDHEQEQTIEASQNGDR